METTGMYFPSKQTDRSFGHLCTGWGTCLAVLCGAGTIATLAAGWGAESALVRELSPADAIAFRFSFDTNDASAIPAFVGASFSDAQRVLLSPSPLTHQLGSASFHGHYPGQSLLWNQIDSYRPTTDKSTPLVTTAKVDGWTSPVSANPEPNARSAAKLAAAAGARNRHQSSSVLNDVQLSIIKKRLRLTPFQEQYWPAVEAALRHMTWKKTAANKRPDSGEMPEIDMSTVDLEGLKSVAFPLVMSFSHEQKRELRSLAYLMGLENLASKF